MKGIARPEWSWCGQRRLASLPSTFLFVASFALLLFLASAVASGHDDAGGDADPGLSTLDGVYTTEQADAVRDVYESACSDCHGRDLDGAASGPQIAGIGFDFFWDGKTLAELHTYMHENMPLNNAGSLSDTEYLGLVALILEANGQPAGETPLPAETEELADIVYEPVNGEED